MTNSTVAVAPPIGSGDLFACMDDVLLVQSDTGGAVKTINDLCPACSDVNTFGTGNVGHIDNFTTNTSCAGHPRPITNLGNFVTMRLQ